MLRFFHQLISLWLVGWLDISTFKDNHLVFIKSFRGKSFYCAALHSVLPLVSAIWRFWIMARQTSKDLIFCKLVAEFELQPIGNEAADFKYLTSFHLWCQNPILYTWTRFRVPKINF